MLVELRCVSSSEDLEANLNTGNFAFTCDVCDMVLHLLHQAKNVKLLTQLSYEATFFGCSKILDYRFV